jgi:hypothetical protein
MKTTFETAHGTRGTQAKEFMTFFDDREQECIAIVTWEYVTGAETIVTSIKINPICWYRMLEASLIEDAYNFIRGQYTRVSFETKGQVTVTK